MLHRNMNAKYYSEVSPEGDAGGGATGGEVETPTEKTYTQTEFDAELLGIRTARDNLKAEKVNAQKAAKAAEDARLATEQESLKRSGSMEDLEKSIRAEESRRHESILADLGELQDRYVNTSKKATISTFAGDFAEPGDVDMVAHLVKPIFEDGEVRTEFTDFSGTVITTDAAEFKKFLQNHPTVSRLMKADGATGGGATGSKNNAGGVATKLTRKEWEALPPTQRMEYVKSGGKFE